MKDKKSCSNCLSPLDKDYNTRTNLLWRGDNSADSDVIFLATLKKKKVTETTDRWEAKTRLAFTLAHTWQASDSDTVPESQLLIWKWRQYPAGCSGTRTWSTPRQWPSDNRDSIWEVRAQKRGWWHHCKHSSKFSLRAKTNISTSQVCGTRISPLLLTENSRPTHSFAFYSFSFS